MLIDNEDETLSELEVTEKKIADSEIPEKYRAKSLEEVVKMHIESEKALSRKNNEMGEIRELADELIKQNLKSKQQPTPQEEPEVDFFENPQKAVQATIDRHPDVLAARQASADFKRMQVQQKLTKEHPDYSQVVGDPDFQSWVKGSPVRLGLYAKADAEFDYESANELLSTFKQLRGVQATKAEQTSTATRTKNMKAAQVDVGGSGESSKRVYRRADLIRLKMTDPSRYESLSDEIMQAYSDGRVR